MLYIIHTNSVFFDLRSRFLCVILPIFEFLSLPLLILFTNTCTIACSLVCVWGWILPSQSIIIDNNLLFGFLRLFIYLIFLFSSF